MRSAAASHLASFRQAFIQWRWPGPGQTSGSGVEVAAALQRWLAQYPEHNETIQSLALGAGINAVAQEAWLDGSRIAEVGLNATRLDHLATEQRQASATLLAFLAARSKLGLGNLLAARTVIEQALDTLPRMDAYAPLASYLQLQRYLLTAELAESSLELSNAAPDYDRAVELVSGITASRRRERDLEAAWIKLAFGEAAAGQQDNAHTLWQSDIRALRRRAVLGLARTAPNPEATRDALALCCDEGLPASDTALALVGVISKLPSDQIDVVVDELASVATRLESRQRATWTAALRALQTEAWLEAGDPAAARRTLELVKPDDLKDADVITLGLAFAARARVAMASASDHSARTEVAALLSIYAAAIDRLSGTALQLRFRAACEPALTGAVRAEIAALEKQPSADSRRQASILLDALRAPEATPPMLRASSPSTARQALDHATDRIGRLAAAVARPNAAAEILVLVIQSMGNKIAFICIGCDADAPIVATLPDAHAFDALRSLSETAEQAIREHTPDLEVEAVGRSAFDALPNVVRQRILRAHTLVIVPDLAAQQDRVPIELLHDGVRFLGMSKVVARCLSLTHALRSLEAPLVSPLPGRRALCASVAYPPGFPALRFATEEIREVGAALQGDSWDATALGDDQADAQSILEVAPLANLIHFACHGEASAGAEALVLADGTRLSAADIATRHRLRGVVYLNACSLAQGRYLGGGVSRGVAYAFVKAGAPCVIANLLLVEDQGAAQLAEAFYHAAREYQVGEAMRRARERLTGRVNAALLAATVVIGDPFVMLGGDHQPRADATSRLFRDIPAPAQLPSASASDAEADSDARFAAALDFARALRNADASELEILAHVARDIGHDVGEAHCWLALAGHRRSSADRTGLAKALRHAVTTLEPLRAIWEPAFEAHQAARAELRALDPAFEPRTLKTVRTESGLSVNDRSDPAVDAMIRLFEAQHEHEAHWRGEPVLRIPDHDSASIAHNAVVWGYLNRVYDTGAEVGVASAFAARAAWRGLVSQDSVPNLQRILTALLRFLWGKQKVSHLEHWMATAQRDVVAIAIDRVRHLWTPPEQSPALPAVRAIASALDRAFVTQGTGSKFAQARAALQTTVSVTVPLERVRSEIEASIHQLHAQQPFAAADFGAWLLGDLLHRADKAMAGPDAKRDVALACTSLYEAFYMQQEGWFMPYLMDGFKTVRESGGQDLFARWSSSVL